ncbi:hypothetical protein SEA_KEELAN_143 [Gordonia phage Keelan]|nr:hypothetical protein SEA_KEELAN_143 [Gordonia phage Keelan]
MEVAIVIALFLLLYYCSYYQKPTYRGNRPVGKMPPNTKPPKGSGGVARGKGRGRVGVDIGEDHVTHKGRSL